MLKAARERLLTNENTKEEEILSLRRKGQETQDPPHPTKKEESCKGWTPTYAYPWPDAIAGLGSRHIGPFDVCADCGIGSWVRYGWLVLCPSCSLVRLGLASSCGRAPAA
jgi:hypothetical protein